MINLQTDTKQHINDVVNSTIETLLNHRSVRGFTEDPISSEMFTAIMEAGRAASTSNFMQSVSVVRITDTLQRIKFHQISNGMNDAEYYQAKEEGKTLAHTYILDCAEYLVFCMDNHRHMQIDPNAQLDWMEVLLISSVDVGIFAQNVLSAAESLGLGGVYIGSMRNDIERAGEVINAPNHVVPLFGMCLGHPNDSPINDSQKPRFPLSVLMSENEYQPATQSDIDSFNEHVISYYSKRGNEKHADWKAQVSKTFAKPVRPQVMKYIQNQGYAKR